MHEKRNWIRSIRWTAIIRMYYKRFITSAYIITAIKSSSHVVCRLSVYQIVISIFFGNETLCWGVFLYRGRCNDTLRTEADTPQRRGRAVVYIVENANGTFSLWRPLRVDIFIFVDGRPGKERETRFRRARSRRNTPRRRTNVRFEIEIPFSSSGRKWRFSRRRNRYRRNGNRHARAGKRTRATPPRRDDTRRRNNISLARVTCR